MLADTRMQETRYSFLARPPPQKKRTRKIPSPLICIQPCAPSLWRASSIAAWAALVQPGSPAPSSPSHAISSPARDMDAELCCPSGFVDMPPSTVPLSPHHPSPSKKRSTAGWIIKRFRSLASRSKSSPKPVDSECAAKHTKGKCGSTAHDLALIQFFAGGSMEGNVRMLMAARAHEGGGGVEEVFRDEKGRIWMDSDEKMEHAHLLGDEEGTTDLADGCPTAAGRSVLAVPARGKKHLGTPRFLLAE